MKLANGYIMLGVSTLTWDGINFPDKTDPRPDKEVVDRYSVEIAFPADMPEYVNELWPEAQIIAQAANPTGIPSNAGFGINQVDAQKIPECAGQLRMRAATYLERPKVFDVGGVELSADQIRAGLYAGAKVRIIVKPSWFKVDKNCGVNYFLDSIQIVDPTAPRLAVANRGLAADTARSAFASAPVTGVPVADANQAAYAATPPGAPAPVAPAAPAAVPTPAPVTPPAGAAVPPTPTPVTPNYNAVPGAVGAATVSAPGSMPGQAASVPAATLLSAPTAPTSPSKQLTAAALAAWPGATYDQWVANGWNDQQMTDAGYLVIG